MSGLEVANLRVKGVYKRERREGGRREEGDGRWGVEKRKNGEGSREGTEGLSVMILPPAGPSPPLPCPNCQNSAAFDVKLFAS